VALQKCVSVLPSILWLSFLSVCLSFLPLLFIPLLYPGAPLVLSPAPPPPPPPLLAGPRPCGLEEDVRQYEQDLAKRLYQARVRASQGTAESPQPPTSSSSSSSSSAAAASQLRSAPRPPGPDALHRRGVPGCFGVGGI